MLRFLFSYQPLKTLLLIIVVSINYTSSAQDLESIGKKDPLKITGGVNLNNILYSANGINSRRDPYSFFASGNINFDLYGWSVPLSFSYSNQHTTFSQPFNQYSIHPTYKWFTGHIGYTSMSYSPYTVGGHLFLGAGVDVAPEGKWNFSALYGRFLKPVEPDTTTEKASIPSFKRMGYAFKASYLDGGNSFDFILFHAKDDISSLSYVPEDEGILPEENLVLSIGAGKSIFNNFILKGEFATSAITRDLRAEASGQPGLLSNIPLLYKSRASSGYYNALKASFNYQKDAYTLGIGYERVDPGYRTLGAYYFNNDLQNITMNAATAILQGKLNLAVTAGTQKDNLNKSKISTMRRLVGSINVNYVPSQKINFSSSYSSFQTFTNIRSQFVDINQLTPYDNLDTLNFTQISQNATLTTMYTLGSSETRRQNLNLNLTWQKAADKQGDVQQNAGMTFYNINTAYSINFVPQNLTASASFNAAINEAAGFNTKTLGPTVAISKSYFERKLRTTLSSSYNNTYSSGTRINAIWNGRLSGAYSIQKKHNLNMSLVVVKRESKTENSTAKSFTEFTGTLGYGYTFSY